MQSHTSNDLVLLLDVTSFTREGFEASCSFAGEPVRVEFDEDDTGVFLSTEMCDRLQVEKGSVVTMIVEANGRPAVTESVVSGVGNGLRVSNAKVYYEVGRNGGGVVRVRRGSAGAEPRPS